MPTSRPPSLADDLRGRDDASLAALLRARPDLLSPVPSDLGSLAARATTAPSVNRALDRLDRLALQVLEATAALPDHAGADDVEALLGVDPSAALEDLYRRALVYRDGDARLMVPRSVADAVSAPTGLGPAAAVLLRGYGPARLARIASDVGVEASGDADQTLRSIAALLADPARLAALLARAPDGAHDALATMTWGPPTGQLHRARREVDARTATSPVEWLLAHALFVATDGSTVVLPREVALHLRDGRVHRQVTTTMPALDVHDEDAGRIEAAAVGAASELVRQIEDLLELWATAPPRVLRAGGLSVRDRNRTTSALDVDDSRLALLAEVAAAAGLMAVGDDGIDEAWLPTPSYDGWLSGSVAERWCDLAVGWLSSTRVPGLVGQLDPRGRVLVPLGPGLDHSAAPAVRAEVLADLASLPDGAAVTVDSLLERARWQLPRRGALRDQLVAWTVEEATALGLGHGAALARHGRLLVTGEAEAAVAALSTALPPLLDEVVLQADLTAVAPGPLQPELGHALRLIADVESAGAATVFRFTEASVRRAFDAGWTTGELTDLLSRHSRTPVPQPLQYLVEDVGRRHGQVRVGAAGSYLRCEDPASVGVLLADRRASALELRRLAQTVLVSPVSPETLLDRLRAMGFAPAYESPQGTVVITAGDRRRAPARRPLPQAPAPAPVPGETLLDAAVRAIRGGERALGARSVGRSTADVLAMLGDAARSGRPLWIGYVDAKGRATNRVVEPVAVVAGHVEAFDHLRGAMRSFAVHRITGIGTVDDDDSHASVAERTIKR